jgi:N-acetylmuramoyl-L-alanine amidase
MVENAPIENRACIIVDAGHGGIDGGATSCTGVLESQFNLQIARRLDDFLHFLGYKTIMIRTTDTSIYTEGATIAQQKLSDLKQRVKIVNETPNGILISIHQNTYPDAQYHGAQVFYANDDVSRSLAQDLQTSFKSVLDSNNNRRPKAASGVYLMQKIQRPGVLIECGFISNPQEELLLRDDGYQKKLVGIIGVTLSLHLG